jgi:hypothetical protein
MGVIPPFLIEKKTGLALATDALQQLERWCVEEANRVRHVLGDSSPHVEGLRSRGWYLHHILERLAEEDDDDAD